MGEKVNSLPRQGPVLNSLMILALLTLAPVTWAAGGYLDALKAEATSDAPTAGTAAGTDDDGRPPARTDDQPQMEEWLKTNYVGSYMFYQRLSETKRKAVYRVYRSGAEITKIREKINELLKQ